MRRVTLRVHRDRGYARGDRRRVWGLPCRALWVDALPLNQK
jgi:hypothetical protein